MLVQCSPLPQAEHHAFEAAIRDSGRDPLAFRAQLFHATAANDPGVPMRRVHVVCRHAAAQYDATDGSGWMDTFARHLARGFFG